MKPGEEWTDPDTGKVYVAEKSLNTWCQGCAFRSAENNYCRDIPCIPSKGATDYVIFKEKEEKL